MSRLRFILYETLILTSGILQFFISTLYFKSTSIFPHLNLSPTGQTFINIYEDENIFLTFLSIGPFFHSIEQRNLKKKLSENFNINFPIILFLSRPTETRASERRSVRRRRWMLNIAQVHKCWYWSNKWRPPWHKSSCVTYLESIWHLTPPGE